jgi:hypothetical protein
MKDREETAAFLDGLVERRSSGELRRVQRRQPHIDLVMSREGWWKLFGLVRERLG